MNGAYREPILAVFPPLNVSKIVPLSEWEQAKQRINKYAPQEQPPQNIIPPKKEEKVPQPPMKEKKLKKESKKFVLLNENEQKLLEAICQGLTPVSQVYKNIKMHPQTAQNAKKKLITLGFATEESIIIKPGRGAKAKILFPTEKAFQKLGIKPPKGSRGGDSAQHKFLVRSIAELIPKSQVEMAIAGKNADIIILYDSSIHQPLAEALSKQSPGCTFQDGQTIAIEIEVSDPAKTAKNNITKNAEAGITTTIIAVLPKEVDRIKAMLSPIIVIDALQLFDFLQAYDQGRAS